MIMVLTLACCFCNGVDPATNICSRYCCLPRRCCWIRLRSWRRHGGIITRVMARTWHISTHRYRYFIVIIRMAAVASLMALISHNLFRRRFVLIATIGEMQNLTSLLTSWMRLKTLRHLVSSVSSTLHWADDDGTRCCLLLILDQCKAVTKPRSYWFAFCVWTNERHACEAILAFSSWLNRWKYVAGVLIWIFHILFIV